MNELDFSGKRVLVVGGSSGIGNGILRYRVVPGSRFRAGTITVAGRVFVVYSL